MKKNYFFFLILLGAIHISHAQNLNAYQIYHKQGQPVNFSGMVAHLSQYGVVLFGEYYNSSINHWLELQTTKALYRLK